MSKLRVITYANGKMVEMDGRVKSVTINGDIVACFRTCKVALINASTLRKRMLTFETGKELRVHYDGKEVFRGILYTQGIDTGGNQTLTAYDYNIALVKNSDAVSLKEKTATAILQELCGKYGIKTGQLASTGYVIKSHIARGKTLFDIITIALTTTYKATGKKYRMISREGKLELIDVKDATRAVLIENERNIISASYSEAIEDTKNVVKLVGGTEKKPITVTESDGDSKAKYGSLQHYEHVSDVKKAGELKTLAKQMLAGLKSPKRSFSVEALGDIEVVSGSAIAVKEAMTGINGTFYVETDTHTFNADNTHTMSLKLTRTNDVPQQEATE